MRFIYLFATVFIFINCSSNKDIVKIENEAESNDSVSYELIVDEPGFDGWIVTNSKPLWYHEQSFYRMWNLIYVKEFNSRVLTGRSSHPFNEIIHYDETIEYNVELDHKLYWYFKYIEQKYRTKLVSNSW